jgi:uncharacterized membrane protein
MPRKIDITLPSELSGKMIGKIKMIKGLIGIRLQKNISIDPEGDVISVEITNRSVNELLYIFEKEGLIASGTVSITTSAPSSIISVTSLQKIYSDRGETNWEEVLNNINKESGMTVSSLLVMFIAGVLAVVGITTNSLHLVIGAMVIAPGFEPITRISLGLVTGASDWKHGLKDTGKAYASLFIGAVITTYIMVVMGEEPLKGESSYLPSGVLVNYWTTIKPTTVLVSIVASAAGGLIILANKSVLTAGVMIALALVPSISLTGMAIATGEPGIAWDAFTRFLLDFFSVLIVTAIVIIIKKQTVHKRNMQA